VVVFVVVPFVVVVFPLLRRGEHTPTIVPNETSFRGGTKNYNNTSRGVEPYTLPGCTETTSASLVGNPEELQGISRDGPTDNPTPPRGKVGGCRPGGPSRCP
jgi:hypothetical protein